MFAFTPESNGRVSLDTSTKNISSENKYNLYSKQDAEQHVTTSHLNTIQSDSILSQTFFSTANQTIIQNAIRYNVWKRTQKVIGEQDSLQLQIIMRSIFLQHARHSNEIPIRTQIEELNRWSLEYCLPKIVSNVKQFLYYTSDISQLPIPINHAVNVSQKGSKSISVYPFI